MMVRRISLTVIFGLLVSTSLWAVATVQDDEKQDKEIAWFDMDHCEICKNMASMKDSMHRIKWETHMLDNGMITVSVVPDDMKEEMAKAEAGVEKTVAKLEQGEQLDMCGFCQNYGKLMMLGAKFKELRTVGVNISIVTSSDPEVVKEIHAMGKRSRIEHEKMLKKVGTQTKLKTDK